MLLPDRSLGLLAVLASLHLGVLFSLIARGRRLEQRSGPAAEREHGDRTDTPGEVSPCEELR
jgi:hypothetical protein